LRCKFIFFLSATRQQALFYQGFVEFFGWQHSGNDWQHFLLQINWFWSFAAS